MRQKTSKGSGLAAAVVIGAVVAMSGVVKTFAPDLSKSIPPQQAAQPPIISEPPRILPVGAPPPAPVNFPAPTTSPPGIPLYDYRNGWQGVGNYYNIPGQTNPQGSMSITNVTEYNVQSWRNNLTPPSPSALPPVFSGLSVSDVAAAANAGATAVGIVTNPIGAIIQTASGYLAPSSQNLNLGAPSVVSTYTLWANYGGSSTNPVIVGTTITPDGASSPTNNSASVFTGLTLQQAQNRQNNFNTTGKWG